MSRTLKLAVAFAVVITISLALGAGLVWAVLVRIGFVTW